MLLSDWDGRECDLDGETWSPVPISPSCWVVGVPVTETATQIRAHCSVLYSRTLERVYVSFCVRQSSAEIPDSTLRQQRNIHNTETTPATTLDTATT